ncbi:Tim44/TimA family putative adaptor protein [Novacetimonas hansenii]|uniref:Tim44/TimA family putative adaptor protein n=1 Tax=Novacetimonas hansenii TaxID=436 RepID=UPI000789B700|nr:Tim44/TimA family putative adaptor protein [Novacetimonas hansenii]RFO99128.1 preprotein translocase subunit Tim44 [Novacetimonas hansenii]WEQ60030.1 Tim44/TimA family putative adaptor protein [Novacetimonas hansenii]CUW46644.1 Tim44-like domain protein [Novacetimonas hansenii]
MDFLFGHFPLDLVFLGLVAVFLVLRLRGILGKRVGAEPAARTMQPTSTPAPVIEGKPEPAPPATTYDIPTPDTRVGQMLSAIAARQQGFTPDGFIRQVEDAFRQIVQAYAVGDIETLRQHLTESTFTAFEAAIVSRQQAHETMRSEIRDITDMAIIDAELSPDVSVPYARIEVRIVSDQVSVTLDQNGQPVSGVDAVTEFSDLWTFERILGAATPGAQWRLGASRSA